MQEYVPIQALDVNPNSVLNFDLYFRLPLNDKYILYRRRGHQMEEDVLRRCSHYNMQNFFVRKEEYNEFVYYVANRISTLIYSTDNKERDRILAETAKNMLSSTFKSEDPAVTQALIQNLNQITSQVIESVLEQTTIYGRNTFQNLVKLASQGTDFQRHPVNTCSFAVLLSIGIDYTNERLLADLAMAAILHDIGLSKLPTHIIERAHDPNSLNLDELKLMQQHPIWTIEILQDRGAKVSELTKTIILQHHERADGQGYPRQLKNFMINELAMILKFADGIDRIVNAPRINDSSLSYEMQKYVQDQRFSGSITPDLVKRLQRVIL